MTSRGQWTSLLRSCRGKERQDRGFGGSGHLDSRSSTLALILQYASGLGPEPEKELALDTTPREAVRHGQARARLPRGVRASSLWHGPAGFPRSKPQVQLHQSQMNDTLLSTDGAAARLHTVRRRTHGSFGSSRTCARGWFLAAAAGCCYYCYCWHCLCLLLLGA